MYTYYTVYLNLKQLFWTYNLHTTSWILRPVYDTGLKRSKQNIFINQDLHAFNISMKPIHYELYQQKNKKFNLSSFQKQQNNSSVWQ